MQYKIIIYMFLCFALSLKSMDIDLLENDVNGFNEMLKVVNNEYPELLKLIPQDLQKDVERAYEGIRSSRRS